MLNELHDIAACLKSVNVSTASWHRHFKTCPTGSSTYLALISDEASVVDLQQIDDRSQLAKMRKWEVEAGVSFPAFNVLPLLEVSEGEPRNSAAEFLKALGSKNKPSGQEIADRIASLADCSKPLWTTKECARITKCLTTLPTELSRSLGEPPAECGAISELVRRATKLNADSFREQLQRVVTGKAVASADKAADWIEVLFFFRGKSPKRVSFVLELSDRSSFPYPAVHEIVQVWINSRLLLRDTDSECSQNSAAGPDAYGNDRNRLGDSFPSARLPVLGNVILRSMSSESPCQKRYGLADSDSFPVGHESRQEMKNALEWISNAERRDKTWTDVSSLNGVASVLFAYPSQMPPVAPEIAGLLAGFDPDADPDGARFEACASRVTESLTALRSEAPNTDVRVFVLTKPDGFRTKVLHSGCYGVSWLLESAALWKHAADNVPSVRIRQFGAAKGDKPFWAELLIPYPAEVVACLNTTWERSGTHAEPVKGFDVGDGLRLLLERGVPAIDLARRALRALISNSQSLVLALGQAHNQGHAHSLGRKYGKHSRLLPSIFGLLLAKIGHLKGDYMKGPPFLIGRLLSLADQLHVQYCMKVRRKQIPPQLVGNALMATAAEQPQKAMAVLLQRILPYQSWACTVQGGDEVRLPKYLLGELGKVSAELKELQLPTKCGDAEKAEMLLGYLTRSEKETFPSQTISEKEAGA